MLKLSFNMLNLMVRLHYIAVNNKNPWWEQHWTHPPIHSPASFIKVSWSIFCSPWKRWFYWVYHVETASAHISKWIEMKWMCFFFSSRKVLLDDSVRRRPVCWLLWPHYRKQWVEVLSHWCTGVLSTQEARSGGCCRPFRCRHEQ